MLVLFFSGVSRGSAQEATPTVEWTATVTEAVNTPTETAIPIETETAAPVEAEAQVSGDVTQVLVKISSNARLIRVQERLSPLGSVVEMPELGQLGIILIEVPSNELEQSIQELQLQTGVAFVEPNYSVQAADVIPNDPGWNLQYGLVAIRAPQGWELSTGTSSVTIAILDSGVDLGHPDLAGKVAAGYDFVNSDNTPQDDFGHGTHVAGIAAAQGNNGLGVAGVSWGAQIMPVKVLNHFGSGSYANVAAGIVWAVDHGAQVINLSLGGALPSLTLESAVLYAYHKGALLVAASGNGGSAQVLYPARYPQVLAVGATNFTNQPASFSNYGPEVDVAAPGENIYSLGIGGTFIESGTSMSAPYVSGLAAILFSFISDAGKVRGAIESSALDVGPIGYDLYSGAGLIQMDSAIALVLPPATVDAPSPVPSFEDSRRDHSNSAEFPLRQASLTPSATVPLPSATMTVTVTQTSTPLSVTLEFTPTLTPTPAPAAPARTLRWQTLSSPYSCSALGLILAGLGLWWFARRRSRI